MVALFTRLLSLPLFSPSCLFPLSPSPSPPLSLSLSFFLSPLLPLHSPSPSPSPFPPCPSLPSLPPSFP